MKRYTHTRQSLTAFLVVMVVVVVSFTAAFSTLPLAIHQSHRRRHITVLYATESLPDIGSMRTKEIREELESYGIKTKSFLEKKEMIEALNKARAEGKKPIKDTDNGTSGSASTTSTTSSSTKSSKTTTSSAGGKSRSERIKEEMEKAKGMKVGELKEKLKERGISTRSFFEKSEFVKAYAESVVDGVNKKAASGTVVEEDEPYDPEYRDVSMQKMWSGGRRVLQGDVIDIKV